MEVRAQQEVLRADLKMSQEELHSVVMELRDRELKAATLQKKLDLLVDKMRAEMGGPEERKSPAYYVVQRAQEREELQKEGDQLDGKIQKAEKEIRALENTLAKLNAKNDNLRSSFHNPDNSSADAGARMELEAKLERMLDKRRSKKTQVDQLSGDINEMRQRLANMRSEEDGMRRHMKLIQAKAAQFDKERQELLAKRERARATVQRASARLRDQRGVQGETEEERNFRLQRMRDDNKALTHLLFGLIDENPDLGQQIEGVLREEGLAPPSRPASAAVSEASSLGD